MCATHAGAVAARQTADRKGGMDVRAAGGPGGAHVILQPLNDVVRVLAFHDRTDREGVGPFVRFRVNLRCKVPLGCIPDRLVRQPIAVPRHPQLLRLLQRHLCRQVPQRDPLRARHAHTPCGRCLVGVRCVKNAGTQAPPSHRRSVRPYVMRYAPPQHEAVQQRANHQASHDPQHQPPMQRGN